MKLARWMLLTDCPIVFTSMRAVVVCTVDETKYQKRISGPLLHRIDIHVEVPRVDYQKLSDDRLGEAIRQRVERARELQR